MFSAMIGLCLAARQSSYFLKVTCTWSLKEYLPTPQSGWLRFLHSSLKCAEKKLRCGSSAVPSLPNAFVAFGLLLRRNHLVRPPVGHPFGHEPRLAASTNVHSKSIARSRNPLGCGSLIEARKELRRNCGAVAPQFPRCRMLS